MKGGRGVPQQYTKIIDVNTLGDVKSALAKGPLNIHEILPQLFHFGISGNIGILRPTRGAIGFLVTDHDESSCERAQLMRINNGEFKLWLPAYCCLRTTESDAAQINEFLNAFAHAVDLKAIIVSTGCDMGTWQSWIREQPKPEQKKFKPFLSF